MRFCEMSFACLIIWGRMRRHLKVTFVSKFLVVVLCFDIVVLHVVRCSKFIIRISVSQRGPRAAQQAAPPPQLQLEWRAQIQPQETVAQQQPPEHHAQPQPQGMHAQLQPQEHIAQPQPQVHLGQPRETQAQPQPPQVFFVVPER